MSIRPTPGRSLVARRAIIDIVRSATLGSYGVTGFSSDPLRRLLGRIGLATPGIRLRTGQGIEVELDLTVALGVPVAEVARQVDSAIRYAVGAAVGRDVERIVIHIDGLRVQPAGSIPPLATSGSASTTTAGPRPIRSADLADSGTDVA